MEADAAIRELCALLFFVCLHFVLFFDAPV
jgi:hypothetical protein